MMQVLIFGAGAIGGYIGGRLIEGGAEVAFVARGERLRQLKQSGLRVRSPLRDIAVPVHASEQPDPSFEPDVVVLTCKAHALGDAIAVLAPAIGAETRILPFLNGVQHLETLKRHFPKHTIWCGIAHGAVTLRPDGVVDHLSPFFSTIIGRVGDDCDPMARDFVGILKSANVDVRLSQNILQDAWNKFVFLTTLAGITCLMRADIGTIMRVDHGPDLVRQLFAECMAVARGEGFPPDRESVRSYLELLTQAGSSLTSSMLRDIESGKATEVEHILGDMLSRGNAQGLQTPLLAICHAHIACYEQARIALLSA